MNYELPAPFNEWLSKVAADPILVLEGGIEDLNAEALENIWSFGFSEEQIARLTLIDLVEFIRAIEHSRETQILERFGSAHPMTFYCFVDEQAGTIRVGIVSACGKLPFSAPQIIVDDLEQIVREYLACPYILGIPRSEFRVLSKEEAMTPEEPKIDYVQVWTSTLPRL